MANEGVLAALESEFRPLMAPKLLAEAKDAHVVWARVKGYPAWPAQVLTEAAALRRKDLGQERHSKGNSVPVMFFGTVEVAWVKDADVVDFKEGLYQGFFDRKTKHFRLALEQVCDYLALDRKRKAPPKWWCKPPSNGLDDQSDGPLPKLVSAAGSGAARGGGPRQDASKSSRQRADAPKSDTETSSSEDEAPAAHVNQKAAVKAANGASGKQMREVATTVPVIKPRDSSTGRLPRENGSTAASTNTAAHTQAKKPPAAPGRQQASSKDIAPIGDLARGMARDERNVAASEVAAATSEAKLPLVSQVSQQQQQRLRSSAWTSVASGRGNGAGLQPRKRLKVDGTAGAVDGPTVGSASSLPPSPSAAAKGATPADEPNAVDTGGTSGAPVLKLPAEIRRLAGIRLPGIPKKPGVKVDESPRGNPVVKADQITASTVPNGSAATSKPVQPAGEGVGMELRSARLRQASVATREGQPDAGCFSGGGDRKRSRSKASSSGKESSEDSDDDEAEEDQNSGEEDDSDAAATSSSDEESDASEEESEDGAAVPGTRRSSRVAVAAQMRGQATRVKTQPEQPPTRISKGEIEQKLRLPRRRTSLRLGSKVKEVAPLKKASRENFSATDSDNENGEAGDHSDSDDSETGGEVEDEQSSLAATSSGGTESASEEERVDKETAGIVEGGRKLRSQTQTLHVNITRPQRMQAARKAGVSPVSQPPSREGSHIAEQHANSPVCDGSDAEATGGKKSQHREGNGAVNGLAARAIPLELRRLQSSPSAAPPVVDTNGPRTLRDRSSSARRAMASSGVTPTQTAIASASAGGKRGASEDGSGVGMYIAVDESRSPEHHNDHDGEKAGLVMQGNIASQPARSQAIDGRSSKAGSAANSASPPPAPMSGGVPVRKKPPSLGVPNTARSGVDLSARQLPAITPARAVLRSLASSADAVPSSTLPVSRCTGATSADALLAPVAVRVLKKPSTGPPTRRLMEPGLEMSISPTDLPEATSIDCKVNVKQVSSAEVAVSHAMATTDGQLPPEAVSVGRTSLWKSEEGQANDQKADPGAEQHQVNVPLQRQALPQNVVISDVQDVIMTEVLPIYEDTQQDLADRTLVGTEADQINVVFAKQSQQDFTQFGAQETAVLCLQSALELELGCGGPAEQQDQLGPQPSSCCQQASMTALTEPVEQAPALLSRSSVVAHRDHELADRSPVHALSAPVQLQHVVVEQAASAVDAQACSNPRSLIHDEALISEEQLPDQGEAMAEHDGHQVFQAERRTLGASGVGSDVPFIMQVVVPASKVVREIASMPSPPPAAPVTPPEGHVASASGAVPAPPACAGSRASSEAECGAGAPAGVSGASCSAPLWGKDDEAAARARARELEELGEVAAALAGLHQAEVPRLPPSRLVTPASQVPNSLRVDPLMERMRTRDSRGLSRSAGSRDNLFAFERASVEGFRWPQPEPLLPSQDQPFALPRDWLVTRPPRYEAVKRNVWLSRSKPKRLPKDEISICACRPPPFAAAGELQRVGCGPNCLNRLSSILCDGKLCPCGELCSNRSLHFLRQPRTEVFLTENRGWGVRTMEPLSKGAFIIEYAGEVIDERELGRRMEHARMNGEPHFYIMELSAGLYIDARRKGNIARLINSSCDPNCETQKWHDASTGEVRVGIFTSRDIAPGEELVYDYFFSTYGALKPSAASFVCMCGSKNCRGTMDLHPEKRRDLGRRVEVFWDGDSQYYRAMIVAYHPTSKKHTVMYEDGGTEKLSLDEVPHRWLDDDHVRASPQNPDAVRANSGSAVVEARQQQQTQVAAAAVGVDLADILPVPDHDHCSIVAVQLQARPLISIDQRCLLPQFGGSSMDAIADQCNGQLNKHGLLSSEIHLPLKKRQRMLQPTSVAGQELSAAQLSSMPVPLGTSGRSEEVYITGNPRGSAGCVTGPSSAYNRLSGGGADSASGDPNGFSGRASLRHESSNTGSGHISSVTAEEDDLNEDLDSLLEAAEAVAALRTAPISNPPLQDTGAPHPRPVRSGSVTAGMGSVAMLQTAKAASPRHMAAVQRAGPPNGLPPHGGSRPSCAATTLPSSSSSDFISYQAGGVRQRHTSYGSAQQGESIRDRGAAGLTVHKYRPSQTRNGRFSGDYDGSAGPLAGSQGRIGLGSGDSYYNGHGTQARCEVNREDLLWKLVGIEKPKNLLPLFSGGREDMRNGDGSKTGETWISPSHPYGSLLRALEASELLPHADQLRLLAQQHAQQQGNQQTEQSAPLRAPQQQASLLQHHTFHHHQQPQQQHTEQRIQQNQIQVLVQQQPAQLARSSGTLPQQPQGSAPGTASSSEALALSAWHKLTQQQQHHALNGSSHGTHGLESSPIAALLHTAQQQQAVAAPKATNSEVASPSAAITASGQLHLHSLQNHGSNKPVAMNAIGRGGTIGASGLPNHIANQQQLGTSTAAAATHWQPPLHSQPGSIMQDLVQLYVAQHAVGSHPILAMASTAAVGVSRV